MAELLLFHPAPGLTAGALLPDYDESAATLLKQRVLSLSADIE